MIRIDPDLCDATAACMAVCPEDVFEESQSRIRVSNGFACTECWICVDNCPSGAVSLD